MKRIPSSWLSIQTRTCLSEIFQTHANKNAKDATSPSQSVKPGEAHELLCLMLCFGVQLVKDFAVLKQFCGINNHG
jgi:hypothetical protein